MNPRAAIPRPRPASGFTLIEIMIVIAIMGLILAMGIPSMFRMAEKDSLRQVLSDLREACLAARAQAIMNGHTEAMTLNPPERSFSAAGKTYSIPRRFVIEQLKVNFTDVLDYDSAPVRFFANGTCDEFTICVRNLHDQRYVHLDCVTGVPEIENSESMDKFLARLERIKAYQ